MTESPRGIEELPKDEMADRLKKIQEMRDFKPDYSWLDLPGASEVLLRYAEKHPHSPETGKILRAMRYLKGSADRLQREPDNTELSDKDAEAAIQELITIFRNIPDEERAALEKGK